MRIEPRSQSILIGKERQEISLHSTHCTIFFSRQNITWGKTYYSMMKIDKNLTSFNPKKLLIVYN